jgi:hypothetical protein
MHPLPDPAGAAFTRRAGPGKDRHRPGAPQPEPTLSSVDAPLLKHHLQA